ncbi:teichoic acids export ABC transporter ATP-binding subunit TagH [Salibacterium qingdaonense]|uniref:Teichoic acid transport system ATP-binding protein n=1 Tax=Salibacterium qingdaonense TaxID=266892 RepID=A0A1I4IQ22_9BACI|nr:teichoic acids export ABC transporter ATP-binding subunit TagH [Salibacterium qingdaonense]SFL56385.1 teichoic acid transport system ATP-binding protein [Salibacterium qingdaonense]
MQSAVSAKNITKTFKLYAGQSERLKDLVLPGEYGEAFYALRDVSFEAEEGDIIGLLGVNGSGKSTLSNIIAGIVPQTSGELTIHGEPAIIDVSSGLNNKLTGRENIEMKCLMLGFTRKEIKKLEPEIIEFAEMDKFIDQPVKSYSKGMKSRLGFSINVSIDPEILIVDEALSVGDKAFAKKSLDKMQEFKSRGKTMFFVSHSLTQMKEFCTKAIWLEFGEIKKSGTLQEVAEDYEAFLQDYNTWSKKKRKEFRQQGFARQSNPKNGRKTAE